MAKRDVWIQALKRENPNRTKWTTKSRDRICSLHFVDGIPFKAKPLPNIHMGYNTKRQKAWHSLLKHQLPAKKTWEEKGEIEIGIINNEVNLIEATKKLPLSVILDDHSSCWQTDTLKFLTCVDKRNLIKVLVNEINELTLENKLLKRKTLCCANSNWSCFTWHKIKTDAKMNFYSGIQTIEMFNVIFILIKPYLPNIVY